MSHVLLLFLILEILCLMTEGVDLETVMMEW